MKYKKEEKRRFLAFLSLPDLKDKQRNPPTHAKMGGVLLQLLHFLLLSVSAPDACSLSGQPYILHFPHLLCVYQWKDIFQLNAGRLSLSLVENPKCVQGCDCLMEI